MSKGFGERAIMLPVAIDTSDDLLVKGRTLADSPNWEGSATASNGLDRRPDRRKPP